MANRYAFFRGCFIPIRLPHIEYVARRVLPNLGIELVDINNFTCCPEPVGFGIHDKLTWLSIAARNLCLAEEQGLDIISLCNGCVYTLKQTNEELKKNQKLKEKVNDILSGTGHQFKGTVEVKHFIQVLNEDIGMRRLRETITSPLDGLKVATHTGCHIVSPEEVLDFDDIYEPVVLDSMVSLLGATPIDYDLKLLCCGWTLMNYGPPEAAYSMLSDKFKSMKDMGADCSTVICPQCFYQFDMGQLMASRKLKLEFKVPVMFYLQLLGLAMGYSLDEMQYTSHRVKGVDFENKIKAR